MGHGRFAYRVCENPVTTQTIRQALRDERPGAWRLAVSLARAGNAALLPEALKQALQTVDRPDADYNSLVGSAALILERGSDDQVQQVADLFHRYESTNEKFYSSLWQAATGVDTPRNARLFAVVLRNRRIFSGDSRYCDQAVAVLERSVHRRFSNGGTTLPERDAAVSKALGWLKAQGLSN